MTPQEAQRSKAAPGAFAPPREDDAGAAGRALDLIVEEK
jgi:hypothetical protein